MFAITRRNLVFPFNWSATSRSGHFCSIINRLQSGTEYFSLFQGRGKMRLKWLKTVRPGLILITRGRWHFFNIGINKLGLHIAHCMQFKCSWTGIASRETNQGRHAESNSMTCVLSFFSLSTLLNFWFAYDWCRTFDSRGKVVWTSSKSALSMELFTRLVEVVGVTRPCKFILKCVVYSLKIVEEAWNRFYLVFMRDYLPHFVN